MHLFKDRDRYKSFQVSFFRRNENETLCFLGDTRIPLYFSLASANTSSLNISSHIGWVVMSISGTSIVGVFWSWADSVGWCSLAMNNTCPKSDMKITFTYQHLRRRELSGSKFSVTWAILFFTPSIHPLASKSLHWRRLWEPKRVIDHKRWWCCK